MDLVEHYRREMPLRYLPVRYEDVIDRQEASVRQMLAFVGAPYDRRCLDFHENRRYARTASYAQVTEKLYDRSRYRYRAYREQLGAGHSDPGAGFPAARVFDRHRLETDDAVDRAAFISAARTRGTGAAAEIPRGVQKTDGRWKAYPLVMPRPCISDFSRPFQRFLLTSSGTNPASR